MSTALPLKQIIEAALLAAEEPLSRDRLAGLFEEDERPALAEIGKALESIAEDCAERGVELREVASGWRFQVKEDLQDWIGRLWTERPQKYTRATLETLALIAYRQPITRGEIENVRGVSLSSTIIRTLQEREWIRIVGHRDMPGKPALFGTTKGFLDYFGLKSLDELPTLAEIRDMDSLEPEFEFDETAEARVAAAAQALPAGDDDEDAEVDDEALDEVDDFDDADSDEDEEEDEDADEEAPNS
ncbi:SMC-Scp complex subunit ScpB [Marinihelvus fidelis]|uniref:SMC-Scp complex subunit ScpB n=1 Tax=Marinihelvus fidelis TaxID=2613842 RepID=A0A5N0TDP9_9GAMM|nr:SMC-Scp complex subunit ScpB [Marinihelvus fidelis]KAA9133100.1 SMC-Scp complex subunit ScpB [Marinihelvus fidelis]